ncbi:MAG: hypothetical protein QM662_17905 [Gordonia sp. (in: high G+C Gram-positive bacteria)]
MKTLSIYYDTLRWWWRAQVCLVRGHQRSEPYWLGNAHCRRCRSDLGRGVGV